MITNIVLDLDGPILDGRRRHYLCYSRILQSHNKSPLDSDLYWNLKRTRMDRRKLLELSNAGDIYETFSREWLDRIEDTDLLELDSLQPNALDTLTHWQQSGVVMTLATMRNKRSSLLGQLERLRLIGLFRDIVICDYREGAEGKASRVSESFGANIPKDSVWIGDTEADVNAADRLGIKAFALTCGLRTEEYLRSLKPAAVLDSLAAVDLC